VVNAVVQGGLSEEGTRLEDMGATRALCGAKCARRETASAKVLWGSMPTKCEDQRSLCESSQVTKGDQKPLSNWKVEAVGWSEPFKAVSRSLQRVLRPKVTRLDSHLVRFTLAMV
jgi:hypothetical protein